jgi:tRNA-specific 2-thiouridylase
MGEYRQFYRYTVGQRKKLGVSQGGRRRYVHTMDPSGHTIRLTDEADLYTDHLRASGLIWHVDREVLLKGPVMAKIRSRAKETEAMICFDGTNIATSTTDCSVRFRYPVRAPAPGQSVVFYRDEFLLGGGIIESPPAHNCAK